MERRKISSSQIRSVGYDPASQTLEVELSSGAVYQYTRVSAEVHRRFLSAPSPGSWFRDNIEESFTGRRIR